MGENVALRFEPKQVNDEQCKLIEGHREAFIELVKKLDAELPGGRCKAIVLTKLEEAAMFCTKAITHG